MGVFLQPLEDWLAPGLVSRFEDFVGVPDTGYHRLQQLPGIGGDRQHVCLFVV
jgi:hypothetical protein